MGATAEQVEKVVDLAKACGANRLTLFGSTAEDPKRARGWRRSFTFWWA